MAMPENNSAPLTATRVASPVVIELYPAREAAESAHRQARRIFGPHRRHIAEDIAQEALARLHKHRNSIKRGWKPLLTRIVDNLARTHFRDKKQRAATPDSDTVEAKALSRDVPTDGAEANETFLVLPSLLDQLDSLFGRGTRAIVDLRAKGIAWAKIVSIVGLKDRACRYRHTRASDWLRERLSLQGANRGNGGST